MATTAKVTYGTSTTTVITLAALTSNTAGIARECTALDNTSNLYLDAMMFIECAITAGTVGLDKCVYIYFYGSEDGTHFNDVSVTGTDAALTFNVTGHNLIGPVVMSFGSSTSGLTSNRITIPSVASIFSGNIPRKWGFVVYNSSGINLSSTEALSIHTYTGLYEVAV